MELDIAKYRQGIKSLANNKSNLIFCSDNTKNNIEIDCEIFDQSTYIKIYFKSIISSLINKKYLNSLIKFLENGGKIDIVTLDKEIKKTREIISTEIPLIYFKNFNIRYISKNKKNLKENDTFFIVGDLNKFRLYVNDSQSLSCFNNLDQTSKMINFFDNQIINNSTKI